LKYIPLQSVSVIAYSTFLYRSQYNFQQSIVSSIKYRYKYLYPYIYIRNTCTSIIPDKKKSLGIYNIKPLDLIV